MSNRLTWGHSSLQLDFEWAENRAPWIRSVSGRAATPHFMGQGLALVDVLTVGDGHASASSRLIRTVVGDELRYERHVALEDGEQRSLELHLVAPKRQLRVVLELISTDGIAAFSSRVRVSNQGSADQVLRSVTSFSAYFGDSVENTRAGDWNLIHGQSDWLAEGRWQTEAVRDLIPEISAELTGHNPRGKFAVSSHGGWSTSGGQPVAVLSSPSGHFAWAWEIQHNGGWRWEIGDDNEDTYFATSGPTDEDHQWTTVLTQGESFQSVPVTIAVSENATGAISELTAHRRKASRKHPDRTGLPVVYNDYMNTVDGDPTSEKLLPLIAAAASVGAEIFCIDAGWYDDDHDWWDSVGEWVPSTTRFDGGLSAVLSSIRAAGMTPGLWLEPESVGVRSPIAATLPDSAFLMRNGERLVEQGRLHLDFRDPAAIAHVDAVIDRLVGELGVGYFKLDYNINPGAGTDRNADSVGAGFLDHNRAHLNWLDSVLERHPGLVLENCASGAMRMDFAMLSRLQLQSTSDQQNPLLYPPIAAAAPLSMAPEQAASWAYPQPFMTREEIAFTLATTTLGRFYLSGWIDQMDDAQLDLVREAIRVNRDLVDVIRTAHPFWPAGLPEWNAPVVALGLTTQTSRFVTIWNRSEKSQESILHFPDLIGADVTVRTVFPANLTQWTTSWDREAGILRTRKPSPQAGARILELVPSNAES